MSTKSGKQQQIALDHFLETALNDAQKKAVLHDAGSLLVIAGAGSGKTRVITAKIAHIILNKQAYSDSILALTFTNKAAREMKERITYFLPEGIPIPFVGTFHSFCVLLLKKFNHLLAKPFFSILDDSDQEKMIKSILKTTGLEKRYSTKSVLYAISGIKNKTINPQKPPLFDLHPQLQDIYKLYEKEKQASCSYDFDDLLIEVLRLFCTNQEFQIQFQHTVQHILVDEYQDTNVVQHELLKKMALFETHFAIDSLCVVGDEDQSIYSWRGAEVANMQHFLKDFPKTFVIKIEHNYRSADHILHLANELIAHNTERTPKTLTATKKGIAKPIMISAASDYQEASLMIKTILLLKETFPTFSQAILYRTHVQSRSIEEELLKHSIPYTIVGGTQFYERKEIKDIIAYLRLIVNPFDKAAFFRIINTPTRGLGAKAEELLQQEWMLQPLFTFVDLINYCISHALFPASKQKTLEQFRDMYQGLDKNSAATDAFSHIMSKTSYSQFVRSEYEEQEAQNRLDNIDELRRAIEHFKNNGSVSVESVIHEIALLQDKAFSDAESHEQRVSLMTLHASKGLEFDVVFIPGIEEGVLPSQRALGDEQAINEERRLLYVGCTRAKELLFLLHTQYRYTYAQMNTQRKSRFLNEIPDSSVISYVSAHKQWYEYLNFLKEILKISGKNIQKSGKREFYNYY